MRWIIAAVLWTIAIVLALVIIRRVRRGKSVVLAGRWSPRVVRMIAVVLVVCGAGEEAQAQKLIATPLKPASAENWEKLPKTVNEYAVRAWVYRNAPSSAQLTAKLAVAKVLATDKPTAEDIAVVKTHARRLQPNIRKLVEADLQAIVDDEELAPAPSVADLTAVLKEMEHYGDYDHWWNAYVWRKATSLDVAKEQEWASVFALFRQHARITDVLIKAHATVKPMMVSQRAWGSKAGPGPLERKQMQQEALALADMLKVAGEQYATTDEGTWKRDGIILLKADKDSPSPVLIRAGQKKDFSTEFTTRIGRLDLLKTGDKPSVILHDSLGKIELPANTLISAATLPKYLNEATKRKLDELVQEALVKNSEDAADRLETMLPLAHQAIRNGLKELPKAKGSPRMRLILSLFDDALMPTIPFNEPPAPQFGGGPGAGPPRGR